MKKKALAVLVLILVVWGLTDVRSRAEYDPENPGKHRTDLTVFTEAGAAFFDGRNPYEVTNPRGWKYLYPPFFALVMAPLHAVDSQVQAVIFFFLSLGTAWGCYAEMKRLARWAREGKTPQKENRFGTLVGWCAFGAALLPSLDCLQRGQIGLLKTWLVLWGARLVWESTSAKKAFLGGLVLALPCVIKIIPALPVGVFLFMVVLREFFKRAEGGKWISPPAIAGVAAGGVLYLFLFPAVLLGWQSNLDHLAFWFTKIGSRSSGISDTQRLGEPHSPRNQSLDNAVFLLGNMLHYEGVNPVYRPSYILQNAPETFMDQPVPSTIVKGIRVTLVLILVPLAWRTARQGNRLDQVALLGLACATALLVSPVARGHYFMFLLAAWWFVPLVLKQRGNARLAGVLACAPPLLVIPHYIWLLKLGFLGYLGIGTTVWYLLACGGLLWEWRPARGPGQNR